MLYICLSIVKFGDIINLNGILFMVHLYHIFNVVANLIKVAKSKGNTSEIISRANDSCHRCGKLVYKFRN